MKYLNHGLSIRKISILFKKIILDYVKMGGGDLGLTPTVGEPFADKNIVSRVKFARSFPEIKKIGTYTNLISLGIFNIDDVSAHIDQIEAGNWKKGEIPKYWDGAATQRIFEAINQFFA